MYTFQTADEDSLFNKERSKKVKKKYETRQKTAKVEPAIEEQFHTGRLLGEFVDIETNEVLVTL